MDFGKLGISVSLVGVRMIQDLQTIDGELY